MGSKLATFYANNFGILQTGYYKKATASYLQLQAVSYYQANDENVFLVLPNLYEAQKYYDALSQMVGNDAVLFYPADQTLTAIMALGSPEFKNERMFTLRQLLKNEQKYLIVTTQQGILQRQLKPSDYQNSVLTLKVNDKYDLTSLIKTLTFNGYQRNYTVERPGEFSLRGNILDIYTHDNPHPYRLDFFGDEIESIKLFDALTQKSFEAVSNLAIAPLSELFYTEKQKENALGKINEYFANKELSVKEQQKLTSDIDNINHRNRLDGLMIYLPFFNSDVTTILDFSAKSHLFVIDLYKMEINQKSMLGDLDTYANTMGGDSFIKLPFLVPFSYLTKQEATTINLYDFDPNAHDLRVLEYIYNQTTTLDLNQILTEYPSYTIIFACSKDEDYKSLENSLKTNKVSFNSNEIILGAVNLTLEVCLGSFIDVNNKVLVISGDLLYGHKAANKIRYRSVINQAIKIRDVSELNVGDYVVHYDFGIGQYVGLKTMSLSGEKRDYLHIVYLNDEYLYTPVDQIDLVLKYRSYIDTPPKLSKLGGKQWINTKAQVKKKIKDMSERLLNLYALRNAQEGFSFSKHEAMMNELENDFAYEETKDQMIAIKNVMADMESKRPMDRLIAGDVGFGKTEVAIRAAFKAVLDAKQVAYLVPTTVLARQHYYTFKQRLDKYGVNVALLSRFVSKSEQQQTIAKLKKGLVDVVIGTHRLLSDDIKFKDLGLFVVDEEQRFGVEHKERIKEMRVNVDTLTLSATPIPRTLQMAIYGIKDLSMIDTPPLNRYPVQTYVVQRQDALIKEAIQRELARGGQVFYLYNKVSDIDKIANKINRLVPEAKITTAHGKMTKERLEDVLSAFIDKQYDILVSTTIIETGVDIPNTNTLIIHDADKLGLAQLYQIRGRVGRSDRIAYAYLMYDGFKDINDEAKKRLSVIEDFTDLGSGFKIAQRDLAIRGAGDILGAEQSGFIDSVGMELYMKLLKEVIEGKEEVVRKETNDEVFASRHISEEYITDDAVRIEIHKRISNIKGIKELEELKEELVDRFGQYDFALVTYMYEKLFKMLSARLGVEKTIVTTNNVELILNDEATKKENGERLFIKANAFKARIALNFIRGKISINMTIKNQKEHWLYLMCCFLDDYLNSTD